MSGNLISLTGNWVQIVAVAWLTWEMTGSTLWLGIMAMAQVVPFVLVTPWAGVLADRYERRKIIFLSQSGACLTALTLFALYELGILTIGILFVMKALLATCVAFGQPARMAMTPELVSRKDLGSAIAFGAVTFNIARFIGPAVAGLIIALGDVGLAFFINAGSFLALLLAVKMLKLADRKPVAVDKRRSNLEQAWDGLLYAAHHRGISVVMSLYLLQAVCIGAITQLFAAYADIAFASGVEGLALLTSAAGLGSILGGVWMTRQSSVSNLTSILCAGIFLSVVLVSIFVLLSNLWIALGVIFLYSSVTVAFRVSGQTLVQLSVEESMRGRVMGVWAVLGRSGPSIGGLIMGGLTDLYGLSVPFIVASVLTGVIVITAASQRQSLSAALSVREGSQYV
ncbi:MAG: MFS transporter [Gammaproteobacteria bacterium]|nr:MFS transporter [Gammaproteobacteria bacterium]